jgi:tetratricopeptide (TPR) repeat protein
MIHDSKENPESAQLASLAGVACMRKIENSKVFLSNSKRTELLNEAENYFRQSISIYPYSFNTNYDLGRVLMDQGQYKEALVQFTNALLFNPNNELGLEEQLRAAYLSKEYQKVQFYLSCNKLSLDRELVLEIAAHTALLTNNSEQCHYYVARGLERFPSNQNFKIIQNELSQK